MSAVGAVLFDIGNVLIEWNPERHYDRAVGPDRRRALFGAVDLDAMNARIDRGEDLRETVYATAAEHPDFADDIRRWHDEWRHLAGPEIPASARVMRALRARGVPVHALSNFGVASFEIAVAAWPVLGEFDRRFISGHMGVIKPEPEIYARVEAALSLPPACLLFTDDRSENIAAAAARGWQTHLFDGPAGWARRLVDEGLLSEEEALA